MNKKISKIMAILLLVICATSLSAAVPTPIEPFVSQANTPDFTEGGHLETDLNVNFLAEWWYLNGNTRLVGPEGKKKDIGFFVCMAHQESPFFKFGGDVQYSHLIVFHGIFFDDGTTDFHYNETFNVPQTDVSNYIALGTPYVDFKYPGGLNTFKGSAGPGYKVDYTHDGIVMDLFFQPNIVKTIDQADTPLNFTTYGNSYGTLSGSIILDGEKYRITQAEAYMDHMIPIGDYYLWPMYMHGWTWFEVTTEKYQAVAYAIRSLEDGYDDYTYKHLTLLNKHNGKIIAEYSGEEITITEPDDPDNWYSYEPDYWGIRKRPSNVVFSTQDLTVKIEPESVVHFDRSNDPEPFGPIGYLDFMCFQPDDAVIQYNGKIEQGSAFYEYLVSDNGTIQQTV
ncbi:MAG: hypothetical protein U9P81_08325 [Euryarchaeota archaeon]|nr:hypothetical protein [Euryarchaeota archaeon]